MRDWFKARNAWGAVFESMPDAEAGKLVKALWSYTMTGIIPECDGYIGGLLTMMRLTLDMDKEKEQDISKKRAAAGLRGVNQKLANAAFATNANNCNQMPATVANGDNKNKNKKESIEKDQESYFILDAEAFAIQKEHDQVLEAAKNAGFKGSPSENADLLRLYAEYGLDKTLGGINACVEHSAPNLAYLRAVLKGTPKQAKINPNSANNFTQRDYSGVQDELMAELEKEMDEFVKTGKTRMDKAREGA